MKNIKGFRCGWCGLQCDRHGNPLTEEQIAAISPFIDCDKVELVNGYCCAEEQNRQHMVQVTRDMAIDAGDRSLEGQWIPWG
jgi:hypothetical protein